MPSLTQTDIDQIFSLTKTKKENFPTFIETGTFQGATAGLASNIFNAVHTIEVDQGLYQNAAEKFVNTNVKTYHGDTITVLPEVISKVSGNLFIWLDGHYSGPDTGIGAVSFPAREECDIINQCFTGKNAVVVIDDARLFSDHNITEELLINCFTRKQVVMYIQHDDRFILHIANK